LPTEWELETDLTPLARALAARHHPRTADAWRHVLDDRPARSIQAEAADWLASEAQAQGNVRAALRAMHAASAPGRGPSHEVFHALYRKAGLDPADAFKLYLVATRLEAGGARAVGVQDPLTDVMWPDQDARWWLREGAITAGAQPTDHQEEAVARARDLALTPRDVGWLMLAEGDHAAGPVGVRALGRSVRAGCADQADEDAFVRIRLCYEGAAERLPDVAWPWYRLAELLAWAGFGQQAAEQLARAERLGLGGREDRGVLRALVEAGLSHAADGVPMARPFPKEPYKPTFRWRLGFR